MLKKNWLNHLAAAFAVLALLVPIPLRAQLLPQPIRPE